jgi:hypothetical protein
LAALPLPLPLRRWIIAFANVAQQGKGLLPAAATVISGQ